MTDANSGEDTLGQSPFQARRSQVFQGLRRRFYTPYKIVLLTMDIFLVSCAYVFAAVVSGYTFNLTDGLTESTILIVMVMITGSFFLTYNLYSYHLIFSKKVHIKNLCIAMGWGALTILLIRTIYSWPQMVNNDYFIPALFLLAIFMLLVSRFFYSQLLNLLMVMGISFLATGFFSVIVPDAVPSIIENRAVLPLGFVLAVLLMILGRYFMVHIVYNVWMRRHFRQQVIIVGSDDDAEKISNHVIESNAPFWINGIVGSNAGLHLPSSVPKNNLGNPAQLPDILEKHEIHEVIITDDSMDKATLIAMIDYCTNAGLTVWFPPKLMPIIDIKMYVDNFCGIKMIRLSPHKSRWLPGKIKHAFDALLTMPLFVLLLPLFGVIAMAIKLNSKGPVFYKAQAIGKGARVFSMYKFRSMRMDSGNENHKEFVTKLIKGEIDSDEEDQPLKIVDDPRITRVGKVLRKLSLDELPQLINVLKGDMSLVGPRPCLPYEYEIYTDWHKKRTTVRPGITGLWQVAGRSEVAFDDMILLDLYYIYNYNLAMDFSALYETIFVVMGRKGAY